MSRDAVDKDQRGRLVEELRSAQAELADRRVEASAGGGAVRVVMSGTQECLQVVIATELLTSGDAKRLEELVLLAVNQAIQESQLMAARRLSPFSDESDQ